MPKRPIIVKKIEEDPDADKKSDDSIEKRLQDSLLGNSLQVFSSDEGDILVKKVETFTER